MAKKELTEEEKAARDEKRKEQLALPIEERELAYIGYDDIKTYLDKNGTIEDLEEFDSVAFGDNDRYLHFKARQWFVEKFFPEKVKGKKKVDRKAEIKALIEKKKKAQKKK